MKKFLITTVALALITTAAQAQTPDGEDNYACRDIREGKVEHDAALRRYYQETCDRMKREQAERARQERVMKDAQDARAARAKAEADRRAKAQAEYDALPNSVKAAREADNLLWNGYRLYAHVKWCYDVREGYAYKYINDAEIERAATAIRFIADKAKKLDANINTDDVWERALNSIKGYLAHRERPMNDQVSICQNSMRELFKLSPAQVYSIPKP